MKASIPYPLRFEIGRRYSVDEANYGQDIGFSDITMSAQEHADVRERIADAILNFSPYGAIRSGRTMARGGFRKIQKNRWLPPKEAVRINSHDHAATGRRMIVMSCAGQCF